MREFTLEEYREAFKADRFADGAGIVIEEARTGYARCSMAVEPRHLNAVGAVNGGAIFTLADFAFAVAANGCETAPTVTLTSSISFLSAARGKRLTAETKCLKSGHTAAFYAVDVTDELGTKVAEATITGFIKGN